MGFASEVLDALEMPDNARTVLGSAQTRDDLADHLHALFSAVVDHEVRVKAHEFNTSTALVKLARQIAEWEQKIVIDQAIIKNEPGSPRAALAVLEIPVLQAQVSAARASAAEAHAAPSEDSPVESVIKELLASLKPAPPTPPTPPASDSPPPA